MEDATGEALAALLRPGNAGSGTTADHVWVLEASLAQLPLDPTRHEVIVRTDSGGTSHGLAEACRDKGVRFVGGCQMKAPLAQVVTTLEKNRWKRAISSDGSEESEMGQVAEVTDLVDLSAWPDGTRMIARRELPHPGAQLRFTDVEGYRYQVFVTDLADSDICYLEALLPRSRTCRVRHPRRQRHRAGQPAQPQFRHQHRLAHRHADRVRPLGLDEGALPRRRAGPGRAQAPALHPLAQRRDPYLLGSTPHCAYRRRMALGRRTRRRLRTAALVGDCDLNTRDTRRCTTTASTVCVLDRIHTTPAPLNTLAQRDLALRLQRLRLVQACPHPLAAPEPFRPELLKGPG